MAVQPDPEVGMTQVDPPIELKIEFLSLAALGRRNPRFKIPIRDWAGDSHKSFSGNNHESPLVDGQFHHDPSRRKNRIRVCCHRFSVAPTLCLRDLDFDSGVAVHTCRR